MENPICQSRTRKSVGFICVNDPADTIAMVTADLAGEFKFEDRRKHSGNRFGAPAHHIIDIGRFGPKGVKDARPALFNFGRGCQAADVPRARRAGLAGWLSPGATDIPLYPQHREQVSPLHGSGDCSLAQAHQG